MIWRTTIFFFFVLSLSGSEQDCITAEKLDIAKIKFLSASRLPVVSFFARKKGVNLPKVLAKLINTYSKPDLPLAITGASKEMNLFLYDLGYERYYTLTNDWDLVPGNEFLYAKRNDVKNNIISTNFFQDYNELYELKNPWRPLI